MVFDFVVSVPTVDPFFFFYPTGCFPLGSVGSSSSGHLSSYRRLLSPSSSLMVISEGLHVPPDAFVLVMDELVPWCELMATVLDMPEAAVGDGHRWAHLLCPRLWWLLWRGSVL